MALMWAAIAALVALPFFAEALRRPAHARRAEAPGRFADLASGWTHFRWQGPAEGAVVVLIHGLTTPSFVWEGLAPILAERGFRVLSYDLLGRGYSAAPSGRQDAAFFLRQLDELLGHEGIDGRVTLVGYSMGGAIAMAFAARHPARVARLLLVASAGLGHDLGPLERLVQRMPVLGDWLMRLFGGWKLRADLRALSGSPSTVSDINRRQIAETRVRGFLPAVLSAQRHLLSEDRSADLEAIARAGLPVAAIWGALDPVIPLAAKDRLAALVPAAEQAAVADAAHGLPHTHPEAVAALV